MRLSFGLLVCAAFASACSERHLAECTEVVYRIQDGQLATRVALKQGGSDAVAAANAFDEFAKALRHPKPQDPTINAATTSYAVRLETEAGNLRQQPQSFLASEWMAKWSAQEAQLFETIAHHCSGAR